MALITPAIDVRFSVEAGLYKTNRFSQNSVDGAEGKGRTR